MRVYARDLHKFTLRCFMIIKSKILDYVNMKMSVPYLV